MRRLLFSSCFAAAVSLALAAPAASQAMPKGDVAISYSVLYDREMRRDSSGVGGWMPAGWVLAGSARITGGVSIVGEAAGNYKPLTFMSVNFTLNTYTFLGGVRYTARTSPRVSPFVQMLLGVGRYDANALGVSASVNGFAAQVGGGVDIATTKRIALRLQGDYRSIGVQGGSAREARFAAGVVYTF